MAKSSVIIDFRANKIILETKRCYIMIKIKSPIKHMFLQDLKEIGEFEYTRNNVTTEQREEIYKSQI